jgi:spore coat protein U-like protein
MKMNSGSLALLASAGVLAAVLAIPTQAGTITGNLSIQMTIVAGCQVSGGATSGNNFGTLNFGSWSLLNQNIDAQQDVGAQVSLACSSGEPYSVSLSDGQNFSSARRMASGGNFVNYELYQDASHSQRWGAGGEALASTGNGSVKNHLVYGRVPVQSVQPAGTYSDTVVVTVAW